MRDGIYCEIFISSPGFVGREWKVVFEAVRIRIDSYCGAKKKKKKGREKIYNSRCSRIVEIMTLVDEVIFKVARELISIVFYWLQRKK